MTDAQSVVQMVHQLAGYPTAFLVAPLVLATFGGARGHRSLGFVFIALMVFLYATGLFLSLTRHEFGTWSYFRNLAFNFFGFSLLLYGYRSIHLYRHPELPRPACLDYQIAWLLTATAIVMLAIAAVRNTPMRVFALVAVAYAIAEWRDIRRGFKPRQILYDRHTRFVLGSFLYVLTVASLVHLGEELTRNTRWLWPTAVGLLLIPLVSSRTNILVRWRRYTTRLAVRSLIAISLVFGGYAMFELATGSARIDGLAMPSR